VERLGSAGLFPGIFVHYTSWDFTLRMMVPSEYRPGRRAYWTDRSGSWMPQLDEGWTPREVAGLLASATQPAVTFEDWVDLAAAFTVAGPRPGDRRARSEVLSWASRTLRAAMMPKRGGLKLFMNAWLAGIRAQLTNNPEGPDRV